jgi:muramoyltetrapeptide carboxypeptidase
MIRPPALVAGDTIAIVSPSSSIAASVPRRTRRGIAELERLGFRVQVQEHALRTGEHTAAIIEQRAQDLNAAFSDPGVAGILCSVGGWAASALLDRLDYAAMAANPTALIGYSDATALLVAIWTCAGLSVVYGPALLPQFGEYGGLHHYTLNAFRRTMMDAQPGPLAPSPTWLTERLRWDIEDERPRHEARGPQVRCVRSGVAEGPLIAAHLGTLLALAGTPYWPKLGGVVLALELDEHTTPGSFDRAVVQLRLAGVLEGVAALVVGRVPPACGVTTAVLDEVLLRETARAPVPIVADLPFGHTDPVVCLPFGVRARVEATEAPGLELLEPAVLNATYSCP